MPGCCKPRTFLQNTWRQWPLLPLLFPLSNTWAANVHCRLPWGWMHHCLYDFMGVLLNRLVLCQCWPFFTVPKGGGGALARECVSLYPNSTITVYDLPKVVQVAKEQLVSPKERQISFHEGRCGQWCGVVTAVAPEPWLCSEVSYWRLRSPAAPYGDSVSGCSLPSLGLQLSQLSISSYQRHNPVIQQQKQQKFFIPEENYLISSEQGCIRNKKSILQFWNLPCFVINFPSTPLFSHANLLADVRDARHAQVFLLWSWLIDFQVLRYFRPRKWVSKLIFLLPRPLILHSLCTIYEENDYREISFLMFTKIFKVLELLNSAQSSEREKKPWGEKGVYKNENATKWEKKWHSKMLREKSECSTPGAIQKAWQS